MFDFHRHINQSELLLDAFYCTYKIEEWDKINESISLGLLMNSSIEYDVDNILIKLEHKLLLNKSFQIGEIGLDKRFKNVNQQVLFLDKCITLAYKYNKVLTIHCVKSYDLLINILIKHQRNMPPLTILHGFSSSLDVAIKLKNLKVHISINPDFIKTKAFRNIKEFDKLGFLIETDWDSDNDNNYQNYFLSFIETFKNINLKNFEEINNEYRTILQNITSSR
ncbi:MAG: TatD family hydrolase [Spirochaetaceae bacterium]|nr:TatD family hydrolase [Spirochaetaceae bacterium]